jgi:hypothetical protein
MNFGTILDDALAYTRNGIFNNMNRWMKLIIAILCLGLPMNGYVMRIYRGENPAPEIENWGTLFIEGLKLMLVGLIYAIPVFIVATITYGSIILAALSGNTRRMSSAMISGWAPNIGLILLMYVVEIAVGVIVPIASIRFARTNSFSEAFNIGAIIEYIGKIGWITYIIALILVALVIGIPIALLVFGFILLGGIVMFAFKVGTIAILGFILALVLIILTLAPLFAVFQARYMTLVYDSAAPVA